MPDHLGGEDSVVVGVMVVEAMEMESGKICARKKRWGITPEVSRKGVWQATVSRKRKGRSPKATALSL